MRESMKLVAYGLWVLVLLLVSGWQPYDRVTWLLEVAPVLLAAPLLLWTRRHYPLTPLLYALIALHMAILATGGAYSYARVPLGAWVQQAWDLARNPYDKLGHLAQGLVPALLAREILWRSGQVRGRQMASFLGLCVALAVSASYELIEWWSALLLGQGADEFLGTQGDPWDTQSDMFCALIGAGLAWVVFAPWQDVQMRLQAGRWAR